MLSIGEFSKICEVSTKTLRYYDEINLIKPEEINPENGYRYYSISQLKDMIFINRLKSYHFSLDEIKEIIDFQDKSEEKLSIYLNSKRDYLQKKIGQLNSTVLQINEDILKLENGISVMSYFDNIEIQLVEVHAMRVLSLRKMMRQADYDIGYEGYFNILYKRIAKENLTLNGNPMTFYHSSEYDPNGNDTEFAVPIKEYVKGTRDIEGGLFVKSKLEGSYHKLTSIYAKLLDWVEREGYEMTDSPYEIYFTSPENVKSEEEHITEVYFPVKKK